MKASDSIKRETGKSNFTLIELLVVIAIIAILSAVLLPALAHAKYTAKQIICVNNVKQMATGILNYTNDFDSWYPTASPGRFQAVYIRNTQMNYNFRPIFRAYFGTDDLTPIMLCPLAQPAWESMARSSNLDFDDLDQTTCRDHTSTPYAFYFGQPHENQVPVPPYWPTDNGNRDSMYRAGDSFIPANYSSKSFRIIMSDLIETNHVLGWLRTSHQSRNGLGYADGNYTNGSMGYRFDASTAKTSASFAKDDGSVEVIGYVSPSELDRRLIRMRGTKSTSVIPLELGE